MLYSLGILLDILLLPCAVKSCRIWSFMHPNQFTNGVDGGGLSCSHTPGLAHPHPCLQNQLYCAAQPREMQESVGPLSQVLQPTDLTSRHQGLTATGRWGTSLPYPCHLMAGPALLGSHPWVCLTCTLLTRVNPSVLPRRDTRLALPSAASVERPRSRAQSPKRCSW